jgi:hypothetical protein
LVNELVCVPLFASTFANVLAAALPPSSKSVRLALLAPPKVTAPPDTVNAPLPLAAKPQAVLMGEVLTPNCKPAEKVAAEAPV